MWLGETLLSFCFVRLIHLDRVFSYMQSLVRAPNRKLLNLPKASFYGLPVSITISSSLSYSPKKLFPLGKSSGFMFLIFLVPLPKFCVLIYFGHWDAIFSFQTFLPTPAEGHRVGLLIMLWLFRSDGLHFLPRSFFPWESNSHSSNRFASSDLCRFCV